MKIKVVANLMILLNQNEVEQIVKMRSVAIMLHKVTDFLSAYKIIVIWKKKEQVIKTVVMKLSVNIASVLSDIAEIIPK